MNDLTFAQLREANIKRLPLFKNSKGEIAHPEPDGSDWSHEEWLEALLGELGEFANIHKKVRRGDRTLEDARQDLAYELADTVIYLDILAFRIGCGPLFSGTFRDLRNMKMPRRSTPMWLALVLSSLGVLGRGIFEGSGSATFVAYEPRTSLLAILDRLDQIARNLDIDLGQAVREKFNIVSDRVGVDVKL